MRETPATRSAAMVVKPMGPPPITAAVKQATGSYLPVLTACAAATVVGLLLVAGLRLVTRTQAHQPAVETADVH